MIKRRVKVEEFVILFSCYLACHKSSFDDDDSKFDEYEAMLVKLMKEEATDVIAFWESDKEDKKIKREIIKSKFTLSKSYFDSGDFQKSREYLKLAFVEGYTFYYGKEFFEFLEKEAAPLLVFINETVKLQYFMLAQENVFKYEAILTGAKDRLMAEGGIKV